MYVSGYMYKCQRVTIIIRYRQMNYNRSFIQRDMLKHRQIVDYLFITTCTLYM